MKKRITKRNVSAAGLVMAVVLLGAGAVVAGNLRQQASFTRTEDRAASIKTVAKAAFNTKSSNKQRIDAIGGLAALKSDDTCHGDWWNDWQQGLLGSTSKAATRCRATEADIKSVSMAAEEVLAYVRDDAEVAAQVASLRIDTADEAWPQTALKAAQRAKEKLDGMRTGKNGEPVLKETEARLNAIISAWHALTAADAKKDKTAYLTAETALKDTYSALGAITDVSDAQLTKVMGEFAASADAVE